MTERLQLFARHRAQLKALFREHLPEVEVWAYGSRVDGRSHGGSDLDLVLRGPGLAEIDLIRLAGVQQALHDSTIPFLVEARDWARLPERFRREIERGHAVLLGKPSHRDWARVRVEEIAEKVAMGPFGSSIKVETYVAQGVPVVNGKHLHGPRLDEGVGFDFISEEHADRLANANVGPGDIVFTHRGTIGQVSMIPRDAQYERYVVSQSQMYLRCDETRMLPEFATQWFRSAEGRHALLANTSQVGVPSIAQPASYVKTILIPLPPIGEQRAIAGVLGTLDDKIELNRRMNVTLASMARALFKSWFVDFDPVRARMEGRDTGLPEQVADLFPDRLVDSEIGEIPEGWEVSEIGKEVDVVGGSTPSTKVSSFWDGGRNCWATPKDLSKLLSPVLLDTSRRITDAGLQKISSGLLPAGTVLLSSRAPIGYLAIAEVPTAVNQGFIAMKCVRRLPNLYVLFWSYENLAYIKGIAGGSTFAEISKKAFRPMPVLVPSQSVIAVFQRFGRPVYERLVGTTRESRALSVLRDTLLPRVFSESRVLLEGHADLEPDPEGTA